MKYRSRPKGPLCSSIALCESFAMKIVTPTMFLAKVLCKGGLLTGSWNDDPWIFAGARRTHTDKSWSGKVRPEGCHENASLQKQPPAEISLRELRSFWASWCNLPAGRWLMFGVRSATVSRTSMDFPSSFRTWVANESPRVCCYT